MVEFVANSKRQDPYKNFRFQVWWDGQAVAGISKVSGLKRTTTVIKHNRGGEMTNTEKSPGRTEYEAITLERGITHNKDFSNWAQMVWDFGTSGAMSLQKFRKDIIIKLLNEAGDVVIAYNVYRCWVSEYDAMPDLDAGANAIAIEKLKLEVEGWAADPGTTEPTEK